MTHPQPSPIVDEVAEAATELLTLLDDYMAVTSITANDRYSQAVERLRAALATPPKAGEGEPVAWRWKAHGHEAGPWIVVHDKGTAEAAMSLFASKGKHQSVQPLYATQQPRVDGVRVTELAQALRNALPEYESWMDGHSDATKSSTCRQLTFGEIRAAYALLAALSLEQGETAP